LTSYARKTSGWRDNVFCGGYNVEFLLPDQPPPWFMPGVYECRLETADVPLDFTLFVERMQINVDLDAGGNLFWEMSGSIEGEMKRAWPAHLQEYAAEIALMEQAVAEGNEVDRLIYADWCEEHEWYERANELRPPPLHACKCGPEVQIEPHPCQAKITDGQQ
jgi:hypothetical protein